MTGLAIILSAPDRELALAWREAFGGVQEVTVTEASILEAVCDAVVSPANSFGFMDGGIDALYSEHFGWDLQLKLRRKTLDDHHGELLVGAAKIVETGDVRQPWLIAAPTMRVPMRLPPETIKPLSGHAGGAVAGAIGRRRRDYCLSRHGNGCGRRTGSDMRPSDARCL